jgi:cellulose synthase/poly-beta-1,6-N-acetylglucosamine synthase-like glycosyltransferase
MSAIEWWKFFKFSVSSLGVILQIPAWGMFVYYLTISFAGWFRRKETDAKQFPAVNRFALIVPSHNEEMVVGKIVENLKAIQYPRELFDIFVIADNCSDNTAHFAREAGAIVMERFNTVQKGKGFSLEWMFDQLFKMETHYDAVCIFDADNLVSSNFLSEMNKHLSLGHKVVQGYLDSKNPFDSWVSANNSIAFWIGNRMFQLPRYYLGLSAVLGGTGMMIATDVLQQIGWGATCLTEDLEFTVKVALKGMKVYWSHEAVIYDEKPLKMEQSFHQRVRWMQGQADVIGRFFGQLLQHAFTKRDWIALDLAIYLVQPIIIVINFFCLVMGVFFMAINPHQFTGTTADLIPLLFFGFLYINVIFLILEKQYSWKTLAFFLTFPFYNLTWAPIVIKGFREKDLREWSHTVHSRALDISEMNAVRE